MSLLLAVTIRGTLILGLVWLLDHILRGRMNARSRRVWWVLVPLSFLLPAGFSVLPASVAESLVFNLPGEFFNRTGSDGSLSEVNGVSAFSYARVAMFVWIFGAVFYLAAVAVRTVRASRYWVRVRLSTDGELLALLEDCKEAAGVSAPIGIAMDEDVSAPALMGWLRPRILLPSAFVESMPREKLRAVLLHELAHFHALDIPLHWLQTLACAVNWFNPFAHLGARAWMLFREEAADECAIAWLGAERAEDYGEAFVEALKHSRKFSLPLGAFVVGEVNQNLKHRMIMITKYTQKTPRVLLAAVLTVVIAATAACLPLRADGVAMVANEDAGTPTAPAVRAMDAWLRLVDAGSYGESWKSGAKFFKKQIPQKEWEKLMRQFRAPLGACKSRVLLGAKQFDKVPSGDGGVLTGDFVIAQFQTKLERSGSMIETVTFEKEADGVWRAAGYFIK